MFSCPAERFCRNPIKYDYAARDDPSEYQYLNYGIANFDNIGSSLLTVYLMIGESWSRYMFNFIDVDFQTVGAMFSMCLIIIGSFFLMNLILASIIQAFIRVQKEELSRKIEEIAADDFQDEDSIMEEDDSFRDPDEDLAVANDASESSEYKIEVITEQDEEQRVEQKKSTHKRSDGPRVSIMPLRNGTVITDSKLRQKRPSAVNRKSLAVDTSIDTTKLGLNDTSLQALVQEETINREQDDSLSDVANFKKPNSNRMSIAQQIREVKEKRDISGDSDLESSGTHIVDLSFLRPILKHQKESQKYLQKQRKMSQDYRKNIQVESLPLKDAALKWRSGRDLMNLNPKVVVIQPEEPAQPIPQIIVERASSSRVDQASDILKIPQPMLELKHPEQIEIPKVNKNLNRDKGYLKHKGRQGSEKFQMNIGLQSLFEPGEKSFQESIFKKQMTFQRRDLKMTKESHKKNSSNSIQGGNLQAISQFGSFRMSNGNWKSGGLGMEGQNGQYLNPMNINAYHRELSSLSGAKTQKAQLNKIIQNVKHEMKEKLDQKNNIRHLASMRVGLELNEDQKNQKQIKKFFESAAIEKRASTNGLYQAFFRIQANSYFQHSISLVIVVNTVLLALDQYPEDTVLMKKVEIISLFLSIVFFIEMIIKLIGLGFRGYFVDKYNIFDGILVVLTAVDIVYSNASSVSSGFNGKSQVTGLRAIRLIRVFKLAKSWKKLDNLIKTIWRTLIDVASFSVLLFLIIFTYALIGLELFSNRAKFNAADQLDMENGFSPVHNFDNFIEAFTTIFTVLTNDSWAQMFFNYYRAVSGVQSLLFFFSLVLLGQKVLLNLFLAILLQNFDESAIKQKLENQMHEEMEYNRSNSYKQLNLEWPQKLAEKLSKFASLCKSSFQRLLGDEQNSSTGLLRQRTSISSIDEEQRYVGTALYFLSIENWLRRWVHKITVSKGFEGIIIVFIMISAVQLALDLPLLDPDSTFGKTLNVIDQTTTIVFAVEALLKIISFGFLLNGPHSYLRNGWNIFDFLIVFCSFIALSPLSSNLSLLKMFRILKALRIVSRNEGLKVIISALLQAVPNIANVVVIMIFFFFICAIIVVSYFKGRLFYCTEQIPVSFEDLLKSKWSCLNSGGTWVNSDSNFDNIFIGTITLMVMATTAGWSDVMKRAIKITDIDYEIDVTNPNQLWIVFFIIFIIVGSFFFLNLFVGVLVSTFNSEKDRIGGYDLLTDKQKDWIETRLMILKSSVIKKLKPPSNNPLRIFLFNLQGSLKFQYFIMGCIVLNSFTLMIQWYDMPRNASKAMDSMNVTLTLIFAIEACIKIVGLGKAYFYDGWNNFDFIIVLISLANLMVSLFSKIQLGSSTNIIRSFRIFRILRLTKRAKFLKLVFNTFIISLPAIGNVGSLFLLFLYIYSIIGMQLFGDVRPSGVMNDMVNFKHFGNSFLTMFIVATGDNWNLIMNSFAHLKSPIFDCVEDFSYDNYVDNNYTPNSCGSPRLTYTFFLSYMLMVNLVFLKLFIAIVLQAFQDNQKRQGKVLNHDMLDHFREVWSDFDPDGTTFIKISDLRGFLFQLQEPLGFNAEMRENRNLQDQFIAQMELPTYFNFSKYQFLNVLESISLMSMVMDYTQVNPADVKSQHSNHDGPQSAGNESNLSFSKAVNKKAAHKDFFQLQVKQDIQKEINQILFDMSGKHIKAIMDVQNSEVQNLKDRDMSKEKDQQLTSLHQAAAQIAVDHMKFIIKKRKAEFQVKQIAKEKEELMLINSEKELIDRVRKEEALRDKSNKGEDHKEVDKSMTSSLHTSTISEEEEIKQGEASKNNISKKVSLRQQRKKSIFFDDNGLQRKITREIIIEEKDKELEESIRKNIELEQKIQKSMQRLVDLQIEARKIQKDSKLLVNQSSIKKKPPPTKSKRFDQSPKEATSSPYQRSDSPELKSSKKGRRPQARHSNGSSISSPAKSQGAAEQRNLQNSQVVIQPIPDVLQQTVESTRQKPKIMSSMGGTGEDFSQRSRQDSGEYEEYENVVEEQKDFVPIVEDLDEEIKSDFEESKVPSHVQNTSPSQMVNQELRAAGLASSSSHRSISSQKFDELVNHLFPVDENGSPRNLMVQSENQTQARVPNQTERSIKDLIASIRDLLESHSSEHLNTQLQLPQEEGVLGEPSQ